MTASAASARISSMLSVVVTPSGSVPMMSPTSLPALTFECTQQPASSSSGCSNTPLTAATPTLPVAHCTTRSPMPSPSHNRRTRTRSIQVYTTRPGDGRKSMKKDGWSATSQAVGERVEQHHCQVDHLFAGDLLVVMPGDHEL